MSFLFAPCALPVLPVEGETNLYFPIHRIYGVARNYAAANAALGEKTPPSIFLKPADAALYAAADKTLELDFPVATEDLQHEIELVVAIGKTGRNIAVEDAMSYVWGYAAGLDLTRRDLQRVSSAKGQPWDTAKAFDESAPMTAVKPAYRTPDNEPMKVWLYVNNEKRQEGTTSEMIMSVPEIISYLSTLYELKAGDLIMTGTPGGIGTIHPGDVLEGGVQGVGVLKVKFKEQ